MEWLLAIPALILALLLLLFFTKVKIRIHFRHQHDADEFYIKFRAWFGILRYTITIPVSKSGEDSPVETAEDSDEDDDPERTNQVSWRELISNFDNQNELIEHVTGFYRVVRNFLGRVKVKKFEWHSVAGTGDAVYTAVLAGGCLGLKGSVFGLLSSYLHFTKLPSYSVTPDFGRMVFNTSLTCILQIQIGEAIFAAIKLLRYWNEEKAKIQDHIS
ncbi:DUF2953 domain-containing protein [Bacillus sp. V59.32b]|uniref:DUF2953 domain-containing protein n=1 Tax=Bacillus sp. V59.32b TaxID=1758642 RepID=UPI00135AFF01|nr:DUF2953 domain-containing protein [Bacillus sp. V59.32b]